MSNGRDVTSHEQYSEADLGDKVIIYNGTTGRYYTTEYNKLDSETPLHDFNTNRDNTNGLLRQ